MKSKIKLSPLQARALASEVSYERKDKIKKESQDLYKQALQKVTPEAKKILATYLKTTSKTMLAINHSGYRGNPKLSDVCDQLIREKRIKIDSSLKPIDSSKLERNLIIESINSDSVEDCLKRAIAKSCDKD